MDKQLEVILQICSEHFGVSVEDIKSRKRYKNCTAPRHSYCYLAKKFTNSSLKGIAKLINRDHTSVIHSIDLVSDCFFTKQYLYEDIKKLEFIIDAAFGKNVTKVVFTFDKVLNWKLFTTNITDNYGAIKYEVVEGKIYH